MIALVGAPQRRSWSPQARYIALGLKIFSLNRRLDVIERQSMARVTWKGEARPFSAKPISQNPDGSWLMEAQEHTGRTVPGTRITVQPTEIVPGTMAVPGDTAGGATAPADDGKAALEAAMAEERKTLVSPADLIAQAQANKTAQTTQGDPGAVPGGPTPAPAGAQASNTNTANQAPQPGPSSSQGTKPMTHLADKLKLLASGTSDFVQQLETTVDAKLAAHNTKKAQLTARINDVFAKTDAIEADADAGLTALENTLNQLTNQ